MRVRDPECAFRLYRRATIERLPIQSNTSVAQIEILAKTNHLECVMAEVAVHWTPPASVLADPVEKNAAREWRRLFHDPDFGKPLNILTS